MCYSYEFRRQTVNKKYIVQLISLEKYRKQALKNHLTGVYLLAIDAGYKRLEIMLNAECEE